MKSELINWVERDGVIWEELDQITKDKMKKLFIHEKSADQMGFIGKEGMDFKAAIKADEVI